MFKVGDRVFIHSIPYIVFYGIYPRRGKISPFAGKPTSFNDKNIFWIDDDGADLTSYYVHSDNISLIQDPNDILKEMVK